jgi:hypothetical protein
MHRKDNFSPDQERWKGHASGPLDTPGITVYYMNRGNSFALPGIGIFVNKHERLLTGYIQHEYGHYLQYKSRNMNFVSYLVKIGIPSALNLLLGASSYDHDRMEIELEATTLAHDFYGPFSELNNSSFPISSANLQPILPQNAKRIARKFKNFITGKSK